MNGQASDFRERQAGNAPKSCGPLSERSRLRTHRIGLVDEQLDPLAALCKEGRESQLPFVSETTLAGRTTTHAEDLIQVLDHDTLRALYQLPPFPPISALTLTLSSSACAALIGSFGGLSTNRFYPTHAHQLPPCYPPFP